MQDSLCERELFKRTELPGCSCVALEIYNKFSRFAYLLLAG